MNENTKYNGWTNYETWVVNLWLTNNEGDAEWLDEIAKGEGEIHDKADVLKEAIEDMNPLNDSDTGASMFTDLLNGALSEVNWYEIIENHLDD